MQGEGTSCALRPTYRGTSLRRNCNLLGSYSMTVPRALWRPWGGLLLLMSEVHLYAGWC